MANLEDWWERLWGKLQRSPALLPTTYAIPTDHTDKTAGPRFKRDAHYFTVTVHRMFLRYDREFWTTYAPMALVVSEFQYDGHDRVVPFVVGPTLLEGADVSLPDTRFLFHDTRVAGVHPYKGGGLKLTVILYRVKRTDFSKKLLKILERIGSVVDLSQALGTYLKIADVLVDTVGDVVGSDADNQPLIGIRREFETGDDFAPGYFALIDGASVATDKLWVRGNELVFGDSLANATTFTAHNYALYRIGQHTDRDDFEKLSPLGDLWKQVKEQASKVQDKEKDLAKAAMATLYQAMMMSPDFTMDHAFEESSDLRAQMKRIQEGALGETVHGAKDVAPDLQERIRRGALDILRS